MIDYFHLEDFQLPETPLICYLKVWLTWWKKPHAAHDYVELVQGKIILNFIRWRSLALMLHTGSVPALYSFDNTLSISCCGESSSPHAQGYNSTEKLHLTSCKTCLWELRDSWDQGFLWPKMLALGSGYKTEGESSALWTLSASVWQRKERFKGTQWRQGCLYTQSSNFHLVTMEDTTLHNWGHGVTACCKEQAWQPAWCHQHRSCTHKQLQEAEEMPKWIDFSKSMLNH